MRSAAFLLTMLAITVPLYGQEPSLRDPAIQQQLDRQAIEIQELREQLQRQSDLLQRYLNTPRPELFERPNASPQTAAADELRALDEPFSPNEVFAREAVDRPAAENTALSGGKFLEALSAVASRTVNGRVHIDQWAFPDTSPGVNVIENGDPGDDPENRLLYRRIRLGVRGTVPPGNMSYRMEIEFSGQDGSQFRDAWIGWDDLLVVQTLRLGNQKRPYGWDHLNSSNFTVFMERPLIVDALNEDNRRFGLSSYGQTEDSAFHWQYGVFYLPRVQDVGSIVDDRIQPEVAGRFGHTFLYDDVTGRNYAHWAVAGAVAWPDGASVNDGTRNNEARFRTRPEGRSDNRWLNTGRIAGAERFGILALESVFNHGRFQWAGELMAANVSRAETTADGDLLFYGGYVYGSWFLTGEHIPWDRQLGVIGRVKPRHSFIRDAGNPDAARGWGAWQVATRLSWADLSDRDVFGGIGASTTLALNWYWNSHSRLQFNYIFGRVTDRQVAQPTAGTLLVDGNYQILGVRCMLDF